MAATMLQFLGLLLGGIGLFQIGAATLMDMWAIQDRSFVVVTTTYTYYGLWNECAASSAGMDSCRPYFTILGLPGLFQATRALMIVGIVLGVIGALISILALKCIRMGSMDDNIKATMTLTSGVLFVLSGICAIAGVSIFANLIVVNFNFTTYYSPQLGESGMFGGAGGGGFSPITPRYTFGSALFVGWCGGAVLVIGGIIMSLACRGMMPQQNEPYKAGYRVPSHSAVYKSEGRPRTVYDESYRAHSTTGGHTKFDYV
ncbi:claudin-18-like isoform X2 [Engraulis encrasicolus]|uniref:claudin-18-like isoform X2 n=1 Tax=Engraulis encrasicolus TaxID=184585 RepID=UPI002FD5A23A